MLNLLKLISCVTSLIYIAGEPAPVGQVHIALAGADNDGNPTGSEKHCPAPQHQFLSPSLLYLSIYLSRDFFVHSSIHPFIHSLSLVFSILFLSLFLCAIMFTYVCLLIYLFIYLFYVITCLIIFPGYVHEYVYLIFCVGVCCTYLRDNR